MHVQVIAIAPTVRQTKSLTNLCGGNWYKANPDGSYTFCFDFKTKREAGQWLRARAHCLAFDSGELSKMLSEIRRYDMLTVDAVTARIQRMK